MAIHQYVYLGSVKKVAEKLNELGCNWMVERLSRVIFQIFLKKDQEMSSILS